MSSITFHLYIHLVPLIASVFFYLDRHHSLRNPPHTSTLSISTTDYKSAAKLYLYTPFTSNRVTSQHTNTIINFQGYAWTYSSIRNDLCIADFVIGLDIHPSPSRTASSLPIFPKHN
ncbi:uncharacterized protein K444DRAFT_123501 [Hyaloscypha bicolor E]|uniref:Uncharacterized protein n=1 Tax=Hyaloscypha bicolor E TaxID=1095630 RepID=A0A2J6TUG3_9HELO|nr:uncharacterized protein K444DRAFT_123501 [Hyaloscypha bicolor E]PMD66662.1 hypothetical protein K444DRAFT_123501 [Hyaloscypha bicolor E]